MIANSIEKTFKVSFKFFCTIIPYVSRKIEQNAPNKLSHIEVCNFYNNCLDIIATTTTNFIKK